jgi:hypothetical protein
MASWASAADFARNCFLFPEESPHHRDAAPPPPRHKSRNATLCRIPALTHKGAPDHEARMKTFLDPNHPMFRRAWVRWATALAPLGWAGFELMLGNPMWAILFGAAGAYAGWVLIVKGPDQP